MIVVTGAAGFIGSCLISFLNQKGCNNLILVDDFSFDLKNKNLANKKYIEKVERNTFFEWLKNNNKTINCIYHLGARTDTTEKSWEVLEHLNLEFSKKIWKYCSEQNANLVYASSAATYGNGSLNFDDNHQIINSLKPLNLYGKSKNDFDIWALNQKEKPKNWYGLKFFNVYGPNEFHKKNMASVIFHTFNKVIETGKMGLFKSYNKNFKDGEQLRDFIYVKDVINICFFLANNNVANGLYNVGTGKARTFLDLAKATFNALALTPNIEFIEMPEILKGKYQYFTEAKMEKLRNAGYQKEFYSLENGIEDYVQNYLSQNIYC